MTLEPSDRPTRLPSSDDLRWDNLARAQQFVQLEQIRATAEKWRNGLATLTGLIATVLVVAGPKASESLEHSWRLLVGGLELVALLGLTLGAWWAMTAAFGIPRGIRDHGVALREWTFQQSGNAERRLTWARWVTLAGFAALSFAAAAAFVGQQDVAGTGRLVTVDEQRYCGSVKTEDGGKRFVVTGIDGTQHQIALTHVRRLELNKTC